MSNAYFINGSYYSAEQTIMMLSVVAIAGMAVVTLVGYLMYRWSNN
jgi:hypothetical protein